MSYFDELGDTAQLRDYYRLRRKVDATLKQFRELKAIWKASVLIGAENEEAGEAAIETWDALQDLTQRLNRLHRQLGIPGPEFELDQTEIDENVTEGSVPEVPWT